MLSDFTKTELDKVNKLLKNGSKSFYAASFLLPKHIRNPAKALYSFCRVADDEIDQSSDPCIALKGLQDRLDKIYAFENIDNIEDRALASVVSNFAIPRSVLDALLEGFTWDANGKFYQDLSDVIDYSVRVAGTVGVMMSLIMGKREPDVLARASDLGVAMQLSNIARDVGEDARAGRIYLPLSWFEEMDLDHEKWLKNPKFNSKISAMVERLLNTAEKLYERSMHGIHELPNDCQIGINAARTLYREIGRTLLKQGLDSVNHRAFVTKQRKIKLLLKVMLQSKLSLRSSPYKKYHALEEAEFLIDQVDINPLLPSALNPLYARKVSSFERNVVWVIDLFEELEKREQNQNLPTLNRAS